MIPGVVLLENQFFILVGLCLFSKKKKKMYFNTLEEQHPRLRHWL